MIGAGRPGLTRVRAVAAFPVGGVRFLKSIFETHTALASRFAERIGLDERTCTALRQTYEQWDGKGGPKGIRGEAVSLPARIVQLADFAEVHNRRHGAEAARAFARKRRGKQFDPVLVDLFEEHADELVADLDAAASCWDAVVEAEPSLDADRRRERARHHARGDGRPRRHEVAAHVGPFARRRQSGRRGGPRLRPAGGGDRGAAASRLPPRSRPARGLQRDLGQARDAEPRRDGARPAASLPDRSHARRRRSAGAQPSARGAPPRAPRRLGLPPRAGRRRRCRPPTGCSPPPTSTTR